MIGPRSSIRTALIVDVYERGPYRQERSLSTCPSVCRSIHAPFQHQYQRWSVHCDCFLPTEEDDEQTETLFCNQRRRKIYQNTPYRYHEAISYDLQQERNKLQIKWIWAFFVEVNLSELLLNDFLPISVSGGRRNVNNGIYRVASLLAFPTCRASKVNKRSVQEYTTVV